MTKFDTAMALLRISTGLSIAYHGYNKIFSPSGLSGTAGWFNSIGMRFPQLQAKTAAFSEIACGLLLVVGLFTVPAAAILVALMLVAIVTVHWKVGYFIFLPNGGWEYCASLVIIGSVLGLCGAGSFSLDNALNVPDMTGPWSLIGGSVAALCHLALTYRPTQTNQ